MSQSVTRNYRGLKGITKDNMGLPRLQGLQGVTRGYLELHGVTGDYKGKNGVTESTRVRGGYNR